MKPLLNVRTGEFTELNEILALRENEFLQEVPEEWDLSFDDFLRSVKTALMFGEWINEATEDEILNKYRVTPGELYGRLNNADWLLYSAQELGLLLGCKKILRLLRKTRIRVKYGIREELMPLIILKGVGRVRARRLWNSGIRKLDDLRKIPLASLERITGAKTAREIKSQVE